MNLSLSETQQALKTTAREFLEKEYPWGKVVEAHESDAGFFPETWRQLKDLGWLGLPFPEAYNGADGNFMDLAVLLEEIGRSLLPSPFTSTVLLCGLPILQFGTDEQRAEHLPKIVEGERIMAMALTEASSRFEATGIELQATQDGNDYILDGTKLFVRDANVADYLLVFARTTAPTQAREGITAFLVDARSSGIAVKKLKSVAMDRQCEVTFRQVRVPATQVLGQPDQGWSIAEWTLQRATLAECLELVGVMQKALDTSIEYAKSRVQFGRPIGSFQGIQFKIADMVTDLDGARLMTHYALWKLMEGQDATDDIARAKVWTSDASRRVLREAHQIHGGVGFIKEHFLHLYFRRVKTGELMYGSSDTHRRQLAASILD